MKRYKSEAELLAIFAPRGGAPEVDITPESLRVFLAYAEDAPNWSGCPLVGGNVGGTRQERGNLTQLKRAGLITTFDDEGNKFVVFTEKGRALAAAHGISLL